MIMCENVDAILHIGAGKTGSSAIQTFLRENSDKLRRKGIIVPAQDLELRKNIAGHSVFRMQDFFDKNGEGLFFHLDKVIKKSDGKCILISAENMSNKNHYRFFKKFGAEYKVKVIIYIRRQDDFFESAWQQWDSKVQQNLNDWIESSYKTQANWLATMQGWERMVGIGNVIPRIFERTFLPEGDVVKDFIDVLGLKLDDFVLPKARVNTSYDSLLTSLVQGRKDVFDGPHDDAFYRFVTPLQRSEKDKSLSLISRIKREEILENYRESNESLRSRYFPDRKSLFSPLDHTVYRYANEVDLQAEQIEMLLGVLISAFQNWKFSKEFDLKNQNQRNV